jgi:hypothetical protein
MCLRCRSLRIKYNDGFIIVYDSIKEASIENGISPCSIVAVCTGKYNKVDRYKWEYYKES